MRLLTLQKKAAVGQILKNTEEKPLYATKHPIDMLSCSEGMTLCLVSPVGKTEEQGKDVFLLKEAQVLLTVDVEELMDEYRVFLLRRLKGMTKELKELVSKKIQRVNVIHALARSKVSVSIAVDYFDRGVPVTTTKMYMLGNLLRAEQPRAYIVLEREAHNKWLRERINEIL